MRSCIASAVKSVSKFVLVNSDDAACADDVDKSGLRLKDVGKKTGGDLHAENLRLAAWYDIL